MDGLSFGPKTISISRDEVSQGDNAMHMGLFDERNPKLNFSSGTVGYLFQNLIFVLVDLEVC